MKTQRDISAMYSIYRLYIEQHDYCLARDFYQHYLADVPMSQISCAIYDYIIGE